MPSFRPKMLAAALTVLFCPTLGAAPYSQIIAFGDSLADSGQYPDEGALGFGVPANRRFTNRVGPTYLAPEPYGDVALQRVARALNVGKLNPSTSSWAGIATGVFSGTNYARGRHTTANVLSSIVDANGSVVQVAFPEGSAPPPQLQASRTRNGYLVDNPVADRNALFYVNGGAIDILLEGTVTDAESAADAAADLAEGINALHDAGARYIVVANVPELDRTALAYYQSQLDPDDENIHGPLSRLYNAALYQEFAASEANIIPLDLAGLLSEAQDTPERFGFANSTHCFDASGGDCIESENFGLNSANPNPDRLQFNDSIHPTTAAQEIIADYTLSILSAPGDIAMLPVFGLQLTQTGVKRQQTLLNGTRGLNTFGKWQITVAVDGSTSTNKNANYNAQFEGDHSALSLYAQRKVNEQWRWGAQLSAGESQFNGQHNGSFVDIESVAASLFTTYEHARYFADAILQFDHLRYANIYRHTPLGQDNLRREEGDSKGRNWALSAEMGYDLSFEGGNWRYGPRLELYAADSHVDGYSEYSSTVTALRFFDQSLASQQADLGVFAHYLSTGKTLAFTGKIGLVSEFDMQGNDLRASLQSQDLPSFHLPGYEHGSDTAVSSQATLSYSPSALARIALHYQALHGDNRSRSLGASITYHF